MLYVDCCLPVICHETLLDLRPLFPSPAPIVPLLLTHPWLTQSHGDLTRDLLFHPSIVPPKSDLIVSVSHFKPTPVSATLPPCVPLSANPSSCWPAEVSLVITAGQCHSSHCWSVLDKGLVGIEILCPRRLLKFNLQLFAADELDL